LHSTVGKKGFETLLCRNGEGSQSFLHHTRAEARRSLHLAGVAQSVTLQAPSAPSPSLFSPANFENV